MNNVFSENYTFELSLCTQSDTLHRPCTPHLHCLCLHTAPDISEECPADLYAMIEATYRTASAAVTERESILTLPCEDRPPTLGGCSPSSSLGQDASKHALFS